MLLDHGRETVGTTPLDAEPRIILKMPKDSFAPVLLSLALTAFFAGFGLHVWWLAIVGLMGAALDILGWLWPERSLGETAEPADV
jgi:cytochrome c oxidase subunit 1/cytochrome c oxidase subunit I+III